jgi:4-amino-4-deoxy-L-arabinose transferase-like glycosyltransferase
MTSFLNRQSERTIALLVIGFGLLLYLPLAGTYGLWDPWETHYGEVARQMTKRGDFISLWWPGSARETEVFQTKPVLSFWLMSIGMHIAGVGQRGGPPDEMAVGHAAEWAVRVPFCLLGVLGLYGVYLVTSRLYSRRAGLLAALVTATCPMYALVARQAMTDMAFVGPMAMALALAALAVVGDPGSPLPRKGRGWASWPHHPLFYGTLAFFALVTLPQLVIDSTALRVPMNWGGRAVTMYGAVVMIPYYLGFLAFVFLAARTRLRGPLYLYLAAILCGLAVLGKGLAGLAMPVVVFTVFLVFTGAWRGLRRPQMILALLASLLACAVVAIPWHQAMYIRHGSAWWNEMFGDNHWRRLMMGRHGDRGTFEYFLRELGYGTLPWLALIPVALARAASALRPQASGERLRNDGSESAPVVAVADDREALAFEARGPRTATRGMLLALGAIWAVTSYAVVSLSMTKFHHYVLPAVPGLGILIGCFLDDWLDHRRATAGVALVGVPLLLVAFADLVTTQNASQRFLWLFSYDYVYNPHGRLWPAVLDFRPTLWVFGILFTLAAVALSFRRARRPAAYDFGASAVLFTYFLIDGFMPKVAPYWSQKETIAAYFKNRRSPEERLIAYRMFWRGETFYSKNAIYEGPSEDRTVFDSDDAAAADEALRSWIAAHRGHRHYFVLEPSRVDHLRALLPDDSRASLTVVTQPSNKFSLAYADL